MKKLKPFLGLFLLTSGCQWMNGFTKGKSGPTETSPVVAASISHNIQTSGIASEDGGAVDFGPCIITLRTSNITCDFDVLVYDSAKKTNGQHVWARQPQSLRLTDDHNMIVTDNTGPEQFLVRETDNRYTAVQATGGIREIIKNSDGTFTAYLDGHGTDVYRTFDSNMRMITSIDPKTHLSSSFKYNTAGLLETRQDANGTLHVTYGDKGMPTKIETANGQRTFVIESTEKAIQVSDGNRPILYLVRANSPDQDLISSIIYGEKKFELSYQNGLLKNALGNNGAGITLDNDLSSGNGKVIVKDSKTGHVQYLAVFQNGRLIQRASPRENQKFTRDDYGRILAVEDANGRKTSFAYDSFGHTISVKNNIASAPKDVSTTEYNKFGQILKFTAGPMTTTYTYDAKGRATSQKDVGPETTHSLSIDAFDDLGRPTRQSEETVTRQTKKISVVYDATGNIATRNVDQGFSQTTETLNPGTATTQSEVKNTWGGSETLRKTANNVDQSVKEYRRTTDYAGRVEEITTEKTAGGAQKSEANEVGPIANTVYDARGNIVKAATVYTSDALFSWAAEVVPQPTAQTTAPDSGGVTEVKNERNKASESNHDAKKIKAPKGGTTAH